MARLLVDFACYYSKKCTIPFQKYFRSHFQMKYLTVTPTFLLQPLFGKTYKFWGNPIVTIFYWAETHTKFFLAFLGSSFFAEFKIGDFAIFLRKHIFLLFYLKIFKISKCKNKVYESLRHNTNYCFYIKTDFPISKNVKN
jgi:hypothetical protein